MQSDEHFNKAVKRIKKIVERWVYCCGLKTWRAVDFEYHRTIVSLIDAVGEPIIDQEDRKIAGKTVVHWRYKEATIHLNVELLDTLSDNDIDYIVRHEICHLLVNEVREWRHGAKTGLDHEERAVSELAMVLGWVRSAGATDVKPATRRKRK